MGFMSFVKSLFEPGVEQPFEELEELIKSVKRSSWKPKTSENDGQMTDSKFSGIPYLKQDEEWPVCGLCGEPMQLFLQLNKKDLPEGAKDAFAGGDILQMFYCTNNEKNCECDSETYMPFAENAVLVRTISSDDTLKEIPESPLKDAFPPKLITDWEEKTDYPNYEDMEDQGIDLKDEESEAVSESGYPHEKDKLLGWPFWVQAMEYPECPDCGEKMSYIFQIDSEDNLPYMFGDAGCGHITQCRKHPERITFAWACY